MSLGVAEVLERSRNSLDSDSAGDEGLEIHFAFGDARQRMTEFGG
jgi:hypothetical protein